MIRILDTRPVRNNKSDLAELTSGIVPGTSDRAVLSDDPKAALPDFFSICTSIFVFNNGNHFSVLKVLKRKEDDTGGQGVSWLEVLVEVKDPDRLETEEMRHTFWLISPAGWKQIGEIGKMRFNQCTLA